MHSGLRVFQEAGGQPLPGYREYRDRPREGNVSRANSASSTRFRRRATVSRAEGKAGAVGFGRGAADVTLREEGGETVLSYSADFQVGGRLAQIGSRLVVGATRKIDDQFFGRLTSVIDEHAERLEPPRAGIRKELVWVAVTVFVVPALIWWLTAR